MRVPKPHFLLFSEARKAPQDADTGQWRFVLEDVQGDTTLEVEEREPEVSGDRLALLAIVRGLEALDQPSRVTLVTNSRYVARGLRYGMPEWRENDWQWERFGQMAPVRNGDLWRRVDRALQYHQVDCRTMWQGSASRSEPAAAARPARDPSHDAARSAPSGSSWWQRLRRTVVKALAGTGDRNLSGQPSPGAARTTGRFSSPSHAGC